MASFRVVSQCGIPRLVHDRPVLVDVNKLHFDQSRPGSTDIKVCGETLTMKGSGNLDLWLVASTDDTYMRSIVGWSVEGVLSFLWCQCTMVLYFRHPEHGRVTVSALRTWNSRTTSEARRLKSFGEVSFVLHRLRVVRPGVVFDTAYRRLSDQGRR